MAAFPSYGEGTFPRPLASKPLVGDPPTLSLMQGTVSLLILRSLLRGPAHGYAISAWIRERTDGTLSMEDAALYQALHRLEARGWVEAEWGVSDTNRRAKYYSLTTAGRRQLRSEVSVWKRYAEAMLKVIDEPSGG